MSDKVSSSSTSFQKHVEILQLLKKRKIFFKLNAEYSASIQKCIEVFCAFLWVVQVLFVEFACIILYFFIFVSDFAFNLVKVKTTCMFLICQFKGGLIGQLFCIWYATHLYLDRKAVENGSRGQG
jgi:hypothetical protein